MILPLATHAGYGFLEAGLLEGIGREAKSASNWIKTQFFRAGLEGILKRGTEFATAVKIELELGAKGGIEGDDETNGDAGEGKGVV